MTYTLDAGKARRFAGITLGHLTREWPYRLDQTLTGPQDLALPRTLHPVFHGSFDWHSCVHGWWQVMRLARLFGGSPEAAETEALADRMLVPDRIAGELAFLQRPMTASFERPYGWGWLLALHEELALRPERPWAAALEPLARVIAARLAAYLPKLHYPIRSGKHDCTAFAMIHALRWALRHDGALAAMIVDKALRWYGRDAEAQPWEPGGEDFLSATLCEAVLMRDVLGEAFASWFARFLPDPYGPRSACLQTPVTVADRADGRLAHLDGLNLSRAWCWRSLAVHMRDPDTAYAIADDHLAAAMPHLADDYMGEHWLATFALLALTAGPFPADRTFR